MSASWIGTGGSDPGDIATTGNVGIGTNVPNYDLEARGTNGAVIAHYPSNSRGGIVALPTQRLALVTTSSADDLVFGYTGATQSTFHTDFTERMRIDNSSGYVGIGTTTPSHKLHVVGEFLADSGTQSIALTYDGVGIGTTAPGQALSVNGNVETLGSYHVATREIRACNDDGLTISDNSGSAKITMTDGGFVGIGTTDPTDWLHVEGAIRIGSSAASYPGTIKYEYGDLYVYDGSTWKKVAYV